MIYPRDPHDIDPLAFEGYGQARNLFSDHEDCSRVIALLQETDLYDDLGVCAIHVETVSRADRVQLTAFDVRGEVVDHDVLYIDDPSQQLNTVPRFDHDFTRMPVAEGSGLSEAIEAENGWIIDMAPVRDYDVVQERSATQRAIFLALARDMVHSGQLKALFLGLGESEGPLAA